MWFSFIFDPVSITNKFAGAGLAPVLVVVQTATNWATARVAPAISVLDI